MAALAICLDSQQNNVSCGDSDCTYGPCGEVTTTNSQTGTSACLDQNEAVVACSDPNCTYGDCVGAPSSNPVQALAAGAQTNGGTSLASTIASLGSVGVAAYTASQQPSNTIKLGASGIAIPTTGTTGIILLVVAVGIAFLAFSGKKKSA